jgi:signal transduction histidine kinase
MTITPKAIQDLLDELKHQSKAACGLGMFLQRLRCADRRRFEAASAGAFEFADQRDQVHPRERHYSYHDGLAVRRTWKLQIQDSGIGITAEMLPRIFDFFEQGGVKVTRQFGGLGLGLAICKGIVELHRGSGTAERSGFAVEDDFREKNLVLRLFLPIWRRYNEIGPVCVVAQGADRSFLASKQLISRCKLCDDDRR